MYITNSIEVFYCSLSQLVFYSFDIVQIYRLVRVTSTSALKQRKHYTWNVARCRNCKFWKFSLSHKFIANGSSIELEWSQHSLRENISITFYYLVLKEINSKQRVTKTYWGNINISWKPRYKTLNEVGQNDNRQQDIITTRKNYIKSVSLNNGFFVQLT